MAKTTSNIGIESAVKDIFDEYRPRTKIKYQLSQTEANLIANQTRVNLKHTTVVYDGPDFLPEPSIRPEIKRYVKRKYKGPVWIFNEEKQEKKILQQKEIIKSIRNRKNMHLAKQKRKRDKQLQRSIVKAMGPSWYHEMSTLQMKAADALKPTMLKDYILGNIQTTIDCLKQLGLVLLPNNTKVKYAFKKCYKYPVQFLLLLFKFTRSKDPTLANCYSLNDKIILSAVAHLSMRETLRELHLRIPSPPRPKIKSTRAKKKTNRKKIYQSPYLKPTIFQPQVKTKWILNRNQYAELEYFDYVEDMYEVTYDETVKFVTGISPKKTTSKYNKPPKIPVRLTKNFKIKRRIATLKKPSSYECPCIMSKSPKIPKTEEAIPEELPAPKEIDDNFCKCGPSIYNKKAQFELNIEVTGSNQVLNLTQKLKPFDTENPVGKLKLKEVIKIKNDDDKGKIEFKHVEYSCECCICKKPINLYDSNNKISDQIKKCHSLSESTIPIIDKFAEDYAEMCAEGEGMGEGEGEGEGEEAKPVCRCKSVESMQKDIFADLDDDYHLCTCKPEPCSACICEKPDANFLLQLERYNAINKTNYKPCFCACGCKTHKKKGKEKQGCKYCFCMKKPPQVNIYEEEEKILISKTKSEKNKARVSIAGGQINKKPESKTLEELIYEEENAMKALPNNLDEMEIELKPEQCICAGLFNRYMNSHNSCVNLYKSYKDKMKIITNQYLEEITGMCTCGDSYHELSTEGEGTEKNKEDVCGCLQAVQDKQKKGKQIVEGCTCGERSASDNSSLNYCHCSHPEIVEVLQKETNSAKSEKPEAEGPPEDNTNISDPKTSKTNTTQVISLSPTITIKETVSESEKQENDPKMFILEKFPTKRKQQINLLKRALAALAEDNYPLAKLPECHKLPHFRVWLDKRTRKYISGKEREEFYRNSKKYWNFIGLLRPHEHVPDIGFSPKLLEKITFAGVHKYHDKLNSRKTEYGRRLKKMYITEGQKIFPFYYHYPLPTKTFRDVFFAYLPSDENHCHVFKPWSKGEFKDLRKRVPCVC